MMRSTRRVFMMQVAAGSTLLAAVATAQAQGAALVNEKDAQAVSLGYVADTTKADGKKYPKHAAVQKCSNCQLFAAKATDASGPCAIFPGKAVAANGWCSAYVKKAG
jgi:hypothetical protein